MGLLCKRFIHGQVHGGGNVGNALTAAARLGLDCRIFTKASTLFFVVTLFLSQQCFSDILVYCML